MTEPITLVTATQNRVGNMRAFLPQVLPYVNRAIIVDGGSVDGTEDYLRSLPKVEYVYRKWDDNFTNQFNAFMQPIKEGWVLMMDDDELPSVELLQSMRSLIEQSEDGNKFCCVEFRCNPISPDIGFNPGPINYWRENFFKFHPGMHYEIGLHCALRGYKNANFIRRNEVYYHIKTKLDELNRNCCYYFIDGLWPTGAIEGVHEPSWHELKNICSKHYPEVKVFADLDNIMRIGNVHPELLDWIKKSNTNPDPLFKQRSCYNTYYKTLHPEEL